MALKDDAATTAGQVGGLFPLAAAVGKAVAEELELDRMLQRCAEALHTHLGAALVRIWVVDRAEPVLRMLASAGVFTHTDGPHARLPFGESQVGQIAHSATPHLTDDFAADPLASDPEWIRAQGMSTFAGHPLVVEGKVQGVLALFAGAPFSSEIVSALTGLADLIAVGVERKRAEAAVRRSEERFRRIIEASPMGILLYRLDFDDRLILVDYNPAAERILDVDLSGCPGKSIEEAFPALAETEVPERYRRLCEEGGSWYTEQIDYRDEQIRGAYEVRAFQASRGRVAVMFLDVTERKRVEEALRDSQEYLLATLNSTADGILVVDREGRVRVANRQFADMWRLPAVPATGTTLDRDLLNTVLAQLAEPEALLARVEALYRTEEESTEQLQFVDGRVFERYTCPLFRDGQRVGRVWRFRDVTGRAHAEEALRTSEATLRSVFRSAPVGIGLVVNREFTWVNERLCEMTGYSADQLVNQSARMLYPSEEEYSWVGEAKYSQIRARNTGSVETRWQCRDGEVIEVLLSSTPLDPDDWSIGVTFTALDITERKTGERERGRLEEQLRHAQKMEAVGQLAGGVAHDFNNLLQAIQGYTELTLLRGGLGAAPANNLEHVLQAVERGSGLVRQLLAFGRREATSLQSVRLASVVADLTGMLQRLIGEQVELRVLSAGDVLPVDGDPGQIEQVLMNLCLNARDAMPDGGRITLQTENHTADWAFAERHPGAPERFVRLLVSDTGAGMSAETRERIFEPFFTTKDVGEGTGLGLATVYAIMQRHSGVIEVESSPGEGTSFALYFPAAADLESSTSEDPPDRRPVRGEGTILLAEDDALVRDLAVAVLEGAGYRVLVASDGPEAVALLDEYAETVDLALLDVVMPKLSGRAVCRHLRSLCPETPVLFCSGYSYDELGGLDEFGDEVKLIRKPYLSRRLLDRVGELLAARRGV